MIPGIFPYSKEVDIDPFNVILQLRNLYETYHDNSWSLTTELKSHKMKDEFTYALMTQLLQDPRLRDDLLAGRWRYWMYKFDDKMHLIEINRSNVYKGDEKGEGSHIHMRRVQEGDRVRIVLLEDGDHLL